MFGVDENPMFLVPMDGVKVPYNTNALPPMQLDVLVGSSAGMMNVAGNNTASLMNLPVKLSAAAPFSGQHKLPVTLQDPIGRDEGVKSRNLLKQIPVSTGLKLSYGEEEYNSSISSAGESAGANLSPILSHSDNLQTEILRQSDELDHYIRIQEDCLRKGIAELKQQHTISLLNALEQEVNCRMRVKDAEIENLNRKNKELLDKIRQIAIEAQSWHYRAKQNESLVNILRSNINQVFLQGAPSIKEGCGENMVDDAVSSSNQNHLDPLANLQIPPSAPSIREPVICRACKSKGVSVLLLPCRHLCLCTDCEAFIDSCPVCWVKKAGSLQVYIS